MRPAEAAWPVADDELDSLFASLAGASTIALAVSGGADSLALLDCIDRWRRRESHPAVIVLSVDHRLRKGSAAEAARVVAIANARGLRARLLVRRGPRPPGDVEAAARNARYGLLLAAAREERASHLLTAHHRDDQAETFLMRLARGSGVFGLAGMRGEVDAGGVILARPFLDLPHSRLVATAAAAGLVAADDPMNRDMRYLRARTRLILPALAPLGIDAERLAATTRRLAGAADALELWASRVMATTITVDPYAVAWLDRDAFLAEPEEIRVRVLVRLLAAVGGEPYPPRFDRLALLLAAVATAGERLKRTLSGVVIEGRGNSIAFYRETGRGTAPETPIESGSSLTFDHRFRVTIAAAAARGSSVGYLGEAGRRAIGARVAGVPVAALATLPAIRRRGRLVIVPTLGWHLPGQETVASATSILDARMAEPRRFSAQSGNDLKPFTLP